MDCDFVDENKRFRYRAAAIIIEDGYVLFARNDRDPYYYSVGGGVHVGEKAEDAVRREVMEEAGVPYEVDRLAFVHENFFKCNEDDAENNFHEITFYFLMKQRGTRELKSDSYSQGVREYMEWLPLDKLDDYTAYPKFFSERLKNMSDEIEYVVTEE